MERMEALIPQCPSAAFADKAESLTLAAIVVGAATEEEDVREVAVVLRQMAWVSLSAAEMVGRAG